MFLVILRKKNYIKYHRHIYVCNPSAKELLYLSILLRATFIASTDSSAFLIVLAIAFFSFFPPGKLPQQQNLFLSGIFQAVPAAAVILPVKGILLAKLNGTEITVLLLKIRRKILNPKSPGGLKAIPNLVHPKGILIRT